MAYLNNFLLDEIARLTKERRIKEQRLKSVIQDIIRIEGRLAQETLRLDK